MYRFSLQYLLWQEVLAFLQQQLEKLLILILLFINTVAFTSLAAHEDVWSATFTNEAKTMYYQVINSTTPTVQANQDGVELPKGVQIWFMGSVAAISEASPAIYKPLKIETKLGINKVDVEGLGALFIRVTTGTTAPGHNITIYCRKEETTVGK